MSCLVDRTYHYLYFFGVDFGKKVLLQRKSYFYDLEIFWSKNPKERTPCRSTLLPRFSRQEGSNFLESFIHSKNKYDQTLLHMVAIQVWTELENRYCSHNVDLTFSLLTTLAFLNVVKAFENYVHKARMQD